MSRLRSLARLAAAILIIAAGAAGAADGVVREDIVFLQPDGKHYTAYKTLRSDIPKRQLLLDSENALGELLYFYPEDYKKKKVDQGLMLEFEQGNYTMMRTGELDEVDISVDEDGMHTFHSWDGREGPDGHYGKWNSPNPFAHFTYIWAAPEGIEILDYMSNRQGKWVESGNTLAWFGQDVNDITFTIRYRPKRQVPNRSASADPQRYTLDASVLFPEASHEITEDGEKLLEELADRLAQRDPARVIVEGHTDDRPLKPYLHDKYPSNWELSAARATHVVRWLADNGIEPESLEARAYGAQQPVAPNDTAEGRARNRRIEILVRDRRGNDSAAGEAEPNSADSIEASGAVSESERDDADQPTGSGTPQSEDPPTADSGDSSDDEGDSGFQR